MKVSEELSETLSSRKPTEPSDDSTGVMLFSSTGHLLFMNSEAQQVNRQLQSASNRESGSCLIPEDINSIVQDLIRQLMSCDHPKDCEHIKIERLCFAADHRLLLRGFCIPDEPLARNSRLLIIIEAINRKMECPNEDVRLRYQLTEREQMVIIYLMLGFTNKEIANRLGLSEYTVKEHLKRIMNKTKTTTRTGLLARMIFPAPQASRSLLPRAVELERVLANGPNV